MLCKQKERMQLIMNDHKTDRSFFSVDLEPTELQLILDRIEENLAFRNIINDKHEEIDDSDDSLRPVSSPHMHQIDSGLAMLRFLQAPLFTPMESGWKALVAPLLNFPIRLFGRKQILYDNQVIELLSHLAQLNKIITEHLEQRKQGIEPVAREFENRQKSFEEKLQNIEVATRELKDRQQGIEDGIRELQDRQHGTEEATRELKKRQQGSEDGIQDQKDRQQGIEEGTQKLEERLIGLDKRQIGFEERQYDFEKRHQNLEEWIRLVHADARDVALSVREQREFPSQPLKSDDFIVPAQRVDPADLPEDLRINVGCGHRPMDGYVNIDIRDIPEANFVADAQSLPFEPGSVIELASSHLVEHYREYEFKANILPYWHSLLAPSGVLRIICPNWEAMVHLLNEEKMTWERFKEITFGGQDNEYNDHFSMYTPQTLTALLNECGFSRVEIVAIDRDNGGCPEMELVAFKE